MPPFSLAPFPLRAVNEIHFLPNHKLARHFFSYLWLTIIITTSSLAASIRTYVPSEATNHGGFDQGHD